MGGAGRIPRACTFKCPGRLNVPGPGWLPMRIAFVCSENTGRSQMAAAFARRMLGDRAIVLSGGTRPAPRITMPILQAMQEVQIDISREVPRLITEEELSRCDHVVGLGLPSGQLGPGTGQGRARNWPLPDPQWRPLAEVRTIRDEIWARVQAFLREIGAL